MFNRKTYLDCWSPRTSSSMGAPADCVCVYVRVFVCSYSFCSLVALKESGSTHTCTHAFKIYASACLAWAISAYPWSLRSPTHWFTHSLSYSDPSSPHCLWRTAHWMEDLVLAVEAGGPSPPLFPFGSHCLAGPPPRWRPIPDPLTHKHSRSPHFHSRSMGGPWGSQL